MNSDHTLCLKKNYEHIRCLNHNHCHKFRMNMICDMTREIIINFIFAFIFLFLLHINVGVYRVIFACTTNEWHTISNQSPFERTEAVLSPSQIKFASCLIKKHRAKKKKIKERRRFVSDSLLNSLNIFHAKRERRYETDLM